MKSNSNYVTLIAWNSRRVVVLRVSMRPGGRYLEHLRRLQRHLGHKKGDPRWLKFPGRLTVEVRHASAFIHYKAGCPGRLEVQS